MDIILENKELIITMLTALTTLVTVIVAVSKAFGSNEKLKNLTAFMNELKLNVLKDSQDNFTELDKKHIQFMEDVLKMLTEKLGAIDDKKTEEVKLLTNICNAAKVDDPVDTVE